MTIRRWKAIGALAAGSYGGMAVAPQSGTPVSAAVHPDTFAVSAPPFPGARHYNPKKVEPLPGGGSLYIYDVNGNTQEYPVPPKGFDPLTATATQLQEYGFPPRPTDPAGLAQWRSDWSHYRSTPTPDVWTVPEGEGLGSSPTTLSNVIASFTNSPEYSLNWSGWEATPPNPVYNPFDAVTATFRQPINYNTSCAQARESQWVGLGGSNPGAGLLQAGTSIIPSSIPLVGPSDHAWFMYLSASGGGSGTVYVNNVTVRPGDTMAVTVQYSKTFKEAIFSVVNETTGSMQPAKITTNAGKYYSGTTADWITERPTPYSGRMPPLYNFGSVSWSNTEAFYWKNSQQHAIEQPLGQYKNRPIIMTNNGMPPPAGSVLAEPTTMSLSTTATGFTNKFHACS